MEERLIGDEPSEPGLRDPDHLCARRHTKRASHENELGESCECALGGDCGESLADGGDFSDDNDTGGPFVPAEHYDITPDDVQKCIGTTVLWLLLLCAVLLVCIFTSA